MSFAHANLRSYFLTLVLFISGVYVRAILQRVLSASVSVDNNELATIKQGLLVYLAFAPSDADKDIDWMIHKIEHLRIFADARQRMNLSLLDVCGQILYVSQFTLYADCRRGHRPSFVGAMAPDAAHQLYQLFEHKARQSSLDTRFGVFAADMQISSVNDGPVTIILNSKS